MSSTNVMCCVLHPTESLAYLTAATHDLTEEAQSIAETLQPTLEKVNTVYMYIVAVFSAPYHTMHN